MTQAFRAKIRKVWTAVHTLLSTLRTTAHRVLVPEGKVRGPYLIVVRGVRPNTSYYRKSISNRVRTVVRLLLTLCSYEHRVEIHKGWNAFHIL